MGDDSYRPYSLKEGPHNLSRTGSMCDIDGMKGMSLVGSGFERKTKREFLDEMSLVVPWAELVSLMAPHAPAPGTKGGRPPFAAETMLRIQLPSAMIQPLGPGDGRGPV